MPYELIADGKLVPLGDRKYLLSPQDLAGLEVLPDLARAGVASLKIEGRLKSPEYVANITRLYREALDRLRTGTEPASGPVEDQPALGASSLTHATRDTANPRYAMEMAFSRGLYTGWFGGTNNQHAGSPLRPARHRSGRCCSSTWSAERGSSTALPDRWRR